MGDALKTNTTLRELDLGGEHSPKEQTNTSGHKHHHHQAGNGCCAEALQEALQSNTALTSLWFS